MRGSPRRSSGPARSPGSSAAAACPICANAKRHRIGYDFIHSVIDDHSHFAYFEILEDEKGATCAAFLLRAAQAFVAAGITRIERLITDNHMSY
jgi:hypothetical protein